MLWVGGLHGNLGFATGLELEKERERNNRRKKRHLPLEIGRAHV